MAASHRLDYDRTEGLAAAIDRLAAAPPAPTDRMLVQVYDGGAKPAASGRVYLGRPAVVSCDPSEGAVYTVTVDASRSIPVVVFGRPPSVGEVLEAHRIGGVWVAERRALAAAVRCGACSVPRADLTFTFTNTLLGTRSAPMVFNGANQWATGCVNNIIFRLTCDPRAGMYFTATFFSGGSCPTGTPVSCTGPGASPLGLTLLVQSCDPLLLQYSATPCSALSAQGYTIFTVTQ